MFARLDPLESKVNKASQNLSKPPSSDGLVKKPSCKPPGGQACHTCTTFKRVADPTEMANNPLPQQGIRCHGALPLEQAVVAARLQIIDVPATVFNVIEHLTLTVICRCGQAHVSKLPDDVTEQLIRTQRAGLGRAFDAMPNAAVCAY
ncbi:DUF6444 domain-containing protein [Janthinobacterium sp. MDT1-19]|uniref:DUF6444 domain-containing protein n=1 Tax=Janthinobacterium sp. MDT1-19 TaxID=1259339 RepID=UPI003F275318